MNPVNLDEVNEAADQVQGNLTQTENPVTELQNRRFKLTACKLLIIFALAVFTVSLTIAIHSWLSHGTLPGELIRYPSILLGASLGALCYESKVDKDCAIAMIMQLRAKG